MARSIRCSPKEQLILLNRAWYMHPNGQLPAYEWEFSDVNPPVQAWAAFRVYQIDRELTGIADIPFLERILHKLLINFTWWVNRKDSDGRNIFQGGFLGLDNIGPFNRSEPAPTAASSIRQTARPGWRCMPSTCCASRSRSRRSIPSTRTSRQSSLEHFLTIASAMAHAGGGRRDAVGSGGWLLLRYAAAPRRLARAAAAALDGRADPDLRGGGFGRKHFREAAGLHQAAALVLENRPKMAALVSRWNERGMGERHLLSVLRGHRLKRLLRRMLDETEFLSDHGVRSLSKAHAADPYRLYRNGAFYEVEYTPGESTSGLFGGNSNWRGPVWMPLNYLLIDALRKYHSYYGPEFKVECPVGSQTMLDLAEVADELARRLASCSCPAPMVWRRP